jgi:hypothetical protein
MTHRFVYLLSFRCTVYPERSEWATACTFLSLLSIVQKSLQIKNSSPCGAFIRISQLHLTCHPEGANGCSFVRQIIKRPKDLIPMKEI